MIENLLVVARGDHAYLVRHHAVVEFQHIGLNGCRGNDQGCIAIDSLLGARAGFKVVLGFELRGGARQACEEHALLPDAERVRRMDVTRTKSCTQKGACNAAEPVVTVDVCVRHPCSLHHSKRILAPLTNVFEELLLPDELVPVARNSDDAHVVVYGFDDRLVVELTRPNIHLVAELHEPSRELENV